MTALGQFETLRPSSERPLSLCWRRKLPGCLRPDHRSAEVAPDRGAIERLHALCGELSAIFRTAKVLAAQACYRPVTRDGLPLMVGFPASSALMWHRPKRV